MNKIHYHTLAISLAGLMVCYQAMVFSAPVTVGTSLLVSRYHSWSFEANRDQAASGVAFLARGPASQLSFSPGKIAWSLFAGPTARNTVFDMRLPGARAGSHLMVERPLTQRRHYYLGNEPRRWHTAIPAFARLRYQQLYPGIDLLFYGKGPRLEYDFEVTPGADPGQIAWSFSGVDQLRLDERGDLHVAVNGRQLVFHRPRSYQEIDGIRHQVASRYVIQGERVSFGLAAYDRSRPLVIDPVVDYSAYLGGGGTDTVNAVAVDTAGNIYVTGRTNSLGLPGVLNGSALQGSFDAFVSKFNAAGDLVYTTYLGSQGGTQTGSTGRGIAVDGAGNVYVTGDTDAGDFPVTAGAFDESFNGLFFTDAFMVKLDNRGQLIYATYLGSSSTDEGHAIAVDQSGAVYVAGSTRAADFPVKHAAQSAYGGVKDAFLLKLTPAGNGPGDLLYATYLGGTGGDAANAMALSAPDRVVIAGETNSTGMATAGAFQKTADGLLDAFVASFDTTQIGLASRLSFTYLGGSADDDAARALALDSNGAVYVTGQTAAANFPLTADASDQDFVGAHEAFISCLSPGLDQLLYSSLMGGNSDEGGQALAVDPAGRITIAGWTNSADFPGANNAPAGFGYHGARDAFLSQLDSNRKLRYSLYLGGSADDVANAMVITTSDQVIIAGETVSTDLVPEQAPVSMGMNQGGKDAFLMRLVPTANLSLEGSDNSPVVQGGLLEYTLIVHNNSADDASNVVLQSATLDSDLAFQSAPGMCSLSGGKVRCVLGMLAAHTDVKVSIAVAMNTAAEVVTQFSVVAAEADVDMSDNSVVITSRAVTEPPSLMIGSGGGGSASSNGSGGGGAAGLWCCLLFLVQLVFLKKPRSLFLQHSDA